MLDGGNDDPGRWHFWSGASQPDLSSSSYFLRIFPAVRIAACRVLD
jgi:hypothetical protein